MFEAIGNGILWIIKYIRVNHKLHQRNFKRKEIREATALKSRLDKMNKFRLDKSKRDYKQAKAFEMRTKQQRLNEETRKKKAATKRLVSQIDHAINTGLANKKTKVKYDGEIHTMTELIRILDGTGIVKKGDDK